MATDPFDVDALLSLPRLAGLTISPDGRQLVTAVTQLDRAGKKFVTALWALDVGGDGPPRRLTRSAPGESGAVFAQDGSLLFTSARPDPVGDPDDERGENAALWRLPAGAGEPAVLAAPPGGVDRVVAAGGGDTVVFAASSHPGTGDWKGDAQREKARKDGGITAQLFTDYPVRHWDQYLGPRQRHLHAAPLPVGDEPLSQPADLIADPGRGLDEAGFDVAPDGRTVVVGYGVSSPDPRRRYRNLTAIDVATGTQRVLAEGTAWFDSPACSPDGRWVAAERLSEATPERAHAVTLWLIELATGEGRDLTPSLDLWPQSPVWSADSTAVYFTADFKGRTPPYRVDIATGAVTRLAARGAFTDLCPSPDGTTLYALHSTVTSPPQPVALDPLGVDQEPNPLTTAWAGPKLPGRVERVSVAAADGTQVWSWLLLPAEASADHPAPLAVLIHGGPLGSWSGWHWRWSPHTFTARGYAVLLPDPALSTGYGQAFIQRGWGRWSDVVYDDVMAAAEMVRWRPDIDTHRTAALGESFGGYMANWIGGHSRRFDALVTHGSLWDLAEFHGSTDQGVWWEQQFGDPYAQDNAYRRHSPNRGIANIATPMLVTHGELDYRVSIGQGLKLWTDLRRHGVESLFLYYPDENHWILKPGNIRLWYATVLNFLDHHVLDQEWVKPDLL